MARSSKDLIEVVFSEHLLCLWKASEDEDKAHFLLSVSVCAVSDCSRVSIYGQPGHLEHLSVTSVSVVGWGVTAPLIGQYSEAPRELWEEKFISDG